MTNENITFFPHDHLLRWTILPLIPSWVTPNHITIFRFFLVPFVLYFLWQEQWKVALLLFLFAALTDAIDGSLARVRKQITMWGTMADPVADKMLVASVVILFVAKEVNPMFAALIVLIEAMTVTGAVIRRRKGKYMSANNYGKIKMVLQVVGVSLLLLAKLMGYELVVPFAVGTLAVAIVFALVSLVSYGL